MSWYLHKAWEPVSSSDSSRVVTGSRSGKERWWTPLVAILAPVGKGGQGGVGWDWSSAWLESRGPRLHREGWGLHAGRLGTLRKERKKKKCLLGTSLMGSTFVLFSHSQIRNHTSKHSYLGLDHRHDTFSTIDTTIKHPIDMGKWLLSICLLWQWGNTI